MGTINDVRTVSNGHTPMFRTSLARRVLADIGEVAGMERATTMREMLGFGRTASMRESLGLN